MFKKLIGFFLISLFMVACQNKEPQTKVVDALTVEELHYTQNQGLRVVSGFVKNGNPVDVKNVMVHIDLLDGNNQILELLKIDVEAVPHDDRIAFRKVLDTDIDIQGVRAKKIIVF